MVHLAYACAATKRLRIFYTQQVSCVLVTLVCTPTHLSRHWHIFVVTWRTAIKTYVILSRKNTKWIFFLNWNLAGLHCIWSWDSTAEFQQLHTGKKFSNLWFTKYFVFRIRNCFVKSWTSPYYTKVKVKPGLVLPLIHCRPY